MPEQRGHGYALDLLPDCAQLLVREGADRISAGTDALNLAMVATFRRRDSR